MKKDMAQIRAILEALGCTMDGNLIIYRDRVLSQPEVDEVLKQDPQWCEEAL